MTNEEDDNKKCLFCKYSVIKVDGIHCNVFNKFMKKDDVCDKWRYKF